MNHNTKHCHLTWYMHITLLQIHSNLIFCARSEAYLQFRLIVILLLFLIQNMSRVYCSFFTCTCFHMLCQSQTLRKSTEYRRNSTEVTDCRLFRTCITCKQIWLFVGKVNKYSAKKLINYEQYIQNVC